MLCVEFALLIILHFDSMKMIEYAESYDGLKIDAQSCFCLILP
jgi:hypothetical protein